MVFEDVIDDLRWALAHLDSSHPGDAGDQATRTRLQLALAIELYYVPGTEAERQALIDTGMAMARRLGDPAPAVVGVAARRGWPDGHRS